MHLQFNSIDFIVFVVMMQQVKIGDIAAMFYFDSDDVVVEFFPL